MTVSKPLRFVLQVLALGFIVAAGYRGMEGDTGGALIFVVFAAVLWFVSRRKTAQ